MLKTKLAIEHSYCRVVGKQNYGIILQCWVDLIALNGNFTAYFTFIYCRISNKINSGINPKL